MAISDRKYNNAKKTLEDAGSLTAAKSHKKHTQGKGSPLQHGRNLIAEAREEFRRSDANLANLQDGMTAAHRDALAAAASEMGI